MARFASTIDNQPIYATRALNDKDGNQIDTTYAKLSDIPNVPVQDVTVDGTSVVNAQGVAEITTPTFTQVQADWTEANTAEPSYIQHKPNLAAVATSGDYSDLSNTPSIPTATSDLQNDSGFITSADIPVTDVEVDGVSVVSGGVASITLPSVPVTDVTVNGTSVVSSGTAAVTVPTATSDLQNDSGFITSSDIPAQVQADWTEADSNDPAYISHKPTLAAVATSGSYADLSNTPTINNVPAVTSSDDNKVLKASYTGGVGSYSWDTDTDTTYSAGTGIDISAQNAISVENPLPSSTSADATKVLTVDSNGVPEWASAQAPISAGNGIDITNNVVSAKVDGTTVTTNSSGELTANIPAQEQSDWAETNSSDPAFILNKPSVKELTAGSNVTITEGTTDITISATDTTYSAGTGIEISNNEISVETPVDVVAGPGIVIDNPDGNTLRVSQAANYEVELWANSSGSNASAGISLSESPYNFDKMSIQFGDNNGNVSIQEIPMASSPVQFTLLVSHINNAATNVYLKNGRYSLSSSTLTRVSESQITFNGNTVSTVLGTDNLKLFKVVGIHRTASN